MQEYFSLLTATGANLLINAVANKTPVKLSKIAVSDSEIAPSEAATELENTKHEFAINSLTQDPQNSSILNIEGVIPSSVGGFNIRKFAIFTQSGEMFAVGRVPLSYKPALNQGAGSDVVFKIRILVGNVSNIELKVDNSIVLATRDWAEKTFLKLTDKIDAYTKTQADDKFALKDDIANATETKAGITKLKNSVTGNSEDTAVTEKAIKEFASGVFQKQENGYQKLPSGLIFQWGSYPTITAGQSKDVNLPVAFPTAGVFCSANDSSDASNMAVMLCKFKSNGQITITNDNSVTTGSRNVSGQWFAIGY